MIFRQAVLRMLCGAVLISTSAPWVKLAQVAPSTSAFYRMLIGGLVMLAYCLWQRRRLWIGPAYALRFLPVAGFFALDLIFWHRSILYVGPGLATLLGNLQVFILALVGWWFLGERPGWAYLAGTLCAFLGIGLLVGPDWQQLSSQYRLGVVFGILTAIAYAAFIVSMQRAQSAPAALSPIANLAVMSILCAVILAAAVLAEGESFVVPEARDWVALLSYAVLCQVAGWLLITQTMPHLPASMIGLLLLLQPALSMVWDTTFFDRPTGAWDIMALVLVLSGIYLASVHRQQQDREQ